MGVEATNSNDNQSIIDSVKASESVTKRGTKIMKPGEEMDKNAFLKILSAELSNQDPTNAKDSTAYVSQMAQFTSIEQLSNLNSNLTFSGASALIGRVVQLNQKDSYGTQIGGLVKGVVRESGVVKINIDVEENGKAITKAYPLDNVIKVEPPTIVRS